MLLRKVCALSIFLLLLACATAHKPTPDDLTKALRLIDQGTAHIRQGDLDQAQAAFEVAYELAELSAAVDGLGCVSFLKGDLLAAEQYFVKAYQMDENYAHSLGNLALLHESEQSFLSAQKLHYRAVEENPKNHRFRNNLAVFLSESPYQEESEQTKKELLKAQALVNHPLISNNLAIIEKSRP